MIAGTATSTDGAELYFNQLTPEHRTKVPAFRPCRRPRDARYACSSLSGRPLPGASGWLWLTVITQG